MTARNGVPQEVGPVMPGELRLDAPDDELLEDLVVAAGWSGEAESAKQGRAWEYRYGVLKREALRRMGS